MYRKRNNKQYDLYEKSIYRKIRRRNRIKRNIHIRRNNHPKDKFREGKPLRNGLQIIKVKLEEDFRLLGNTERVIKTINDSIHYVNEHGKYRIVFELADVTSLDIGAVGLLLSTVTILSKKGIHVFGTMPQDKSCRAFLIETGFLDHVRIIQGKKPGRKNENNLLIERGFDKTSNNRIGNEVRKAVFSLTDRNEGFRPVYSIIQEMCANSIEHANQNIGEKNWLVSIYYPSRDRVVFTMIDIGKGIISTLKKKLTQQIRDAFSLVGDLGTLKGVFNKKYQSSTFEENRNQGLPKIRETFNSGYIDNLKVITNNVLVDFSDDSKSRVLRNKMHGTFYYWELARQNIETWKNRTKIK